MVYLGIITWIVVSDARAALGLTRVVGPDIESMLVNHGTYIPPGDSLVRPTQLHLVLRIAELADSLEDQNVPTLQRRNRFASVLNSHSFGRSEYRWVRNALVRAISKPQTTADSGNVRLVEPLRDRALHMSQVFQDSLDHEILRGMKP